MKSILVANRGEIACRVIRTARDMGIRTISVYSEADADSPHVSAADEAALIGPPAPSASYLCIDRLLQAAKDFGADAVHPGYGFLSENPDFARAVEAADLTWIGPRPGVIEAMGNKVAARNRMAAAGVPCATGTRAAVQGQSDLLEAAREIGYPVMVKASGGGGGIGMAIARDDSSLLDAFASARSRAERFFGDGAVFLERFIENARHVEVQILGLADGRIVVLGERDCSVQRRHQKVCEETPSPGVSDDLREQMFASAIRCGEVMDYRGAGTVEFLVDTRAQTFVFLEMNTRLQVEHPITEMVTGVDIVEQQILIAGGAQPSFNPEQVESRGHAIEFRVYAEDPKHFLPSAGTIETWREPRGPGIRVDSGYHEGGTVTPHYDPLMAKLCVHGRDREEVLERARSAVANFGVQGPKTNLPLFQELLEFSPFVAGDYDTSVLDQLNQRRPPQ